MLDSPRSSPVSSALAWSLSALGLLAVSCVPLGGEQAVDTKVAAVTAAPAGPSDLDLLFVVDDSPEMTVMQKKLAAQIPTFIDALANLPGGLPNLHVAVISSDLGAPGDSTASIGCTTAGDQGLFQLPASSCTTATLTPGARYLSNVGGSANYTGDLADLLTCMIPLGETGCGFGQQLGSLARAIGADGTSPPAENAGFLRPDAQLAIVVLSHADDCSAPPTTVLYSLNGPYTDLSNALGPLTTFRCNRWGHLCIDPAVDSTAYSQPPLVPPADAQGPPSAPTLNLTACQSLEDDSLLTPVSVFVDGVEAIKTDPEHQIVVGAIVAPPEPYTVAWLTHDGEIWPQIEHACGSGTEVNPAGQVTTDGSFGDPAVRLAQWVRGFGENGITTSICDGSYANGFGAIVNRIAAHLQNAGVTTGAGGAGSGTGSGGVVTSGGGSSLGAAGGGGIDGTGGIVVPTGGQGGNVGSGGGPDGARAPNEGLHPGGCDIGASTPGASTLAALVALLALARRRPRDA